MSSVHDSEARAPTQPTASHTPSPLPEVHDNSSLVSNPQSSFQELSPPITPDGQKLGTLHLQPATVQELFDIDRFIYGDYDLVDGLLIWRGMSERDRNKQQAKNLLHLFQQREQANPTSNRVATVQASIAIPTKRYLRSQPSSSSAPPLSEDSDESSAPRNGHPNYSVLTADLAIGQKLSEEERRKLSPASKNITFPLLNPKRPPEAVYECSSTKESRDMKEKPDLYAAAEIPKYIVLNNRVRSKRSQPAVHEGNLRDGKYEGLNMPLRGTDKVDLGPIGILDAKDCINPGDVDGRVHREGREQRMRRQEAEKRKQEEKEKRRKAEEREQEEKEKRRKAEEREQEEKKKRQQAEEREQEEKKKRQKAEEKRQKAEEREQKGKRKRREREAKIKEQRELMRKAGLLVSDSSSSSKSSPSSSSKSSPSSSSKSSPSSSSSVARSPPRKKPK